MQEQPHYKITPDQGWAKMKPVLDDVMPVSSTTRRYPFIWWTTTAMIVTIIVGFTLLKDTILKDNPASTANTTTQAPAAMQHVQQVLETNTSNQHPIEANEFNSTTAPGVAAHQLPSGVEIKEQSHELKPSKAPSKTSPSGHRGSFKAKSIPMSMVDDRDMEDMALPPNVESRPEVAGAETNSNSLSENTPSVTELTSTIPLRNGQVVDALPVLNEVPFNGPAYHQDIVPAGRVTKSKRQPSFIEPSLAVSGFAGQQGGLGAFAGGGINMNITRRFCFTSSIGYFTYNPDGALLGRSKSLDANAEYNSILIYDPVYPGNEIYVDANSVNNQAGYNAISPLVDKVTQWQVSAGLKWKFNRRFYTEGGVSIGLNTSAYSSYPIAEQDPLSSTPVVRFQNSLNDFNIIRSTTTSLYAGVGYRFGQHIDLFSNWNHGLDQYLLNETITPNADLDSGKRTDYIRGLSLGLRYTL